MSERLAYSAFAAGWVLVRRLPEPVAYAVFALLADATWLWRGRGVRQLERNLARVVDDGRRAGIGAPAAGGARGRALSRAALRSYLRYWCDTFRLPDWDRERTVGTVRVVNEHLLREPLDAGRGVVAALPHMANWDHAGAWACLTGARVTTVAERLRPERLYDRFRAFRESLGMEILPLTGGAEPVMDVLLRRAGSGSFVPLLADRDLSGRGVPVTFFGDVARFAPGPALLAARTGAALLPVTLHFEGRTLVLTLHPHVEPSPGPGGLAGKVRAMTQEVASVFEAAVREHPQDWHMLQPFFDSDRRAAESRAPRAASPRHPAASPRDLAGSPRHPAGNERRARGTTP